MKTREVVLATRIQEDSKHSAEDATKFGFYYADSATAKAIE